VISGTISVTDSNGREINLGPTDSLYIANGEKRSIMNKTNQPATMIVVSSYPK
jgi:mannose-6-phosphate isomerase-like protein (cupin superfamily)